MKNKKNKVTAFPTVDKKQDVLKVIDDIIELINKGELIPKQILIIVKRIITLIQN